MKTPAYLGFALLVALSLAYANSRGWSAMGYLQAKTWSKLGPSTQHK